MRKKYLDNIRWFIILLVLLDHTVCIFSACKSPMSYNTTGIEALDAIGYMIYPWFMSCLFVVAGMSAAYALQKRSYKAFIKDRTQRLLVPFIAYLFLVGPFASALSFKVNHLEEAFVKLPSFVILIIRIISGMGPAWFLLQLFIISCLWVLILKLDKKQKLMQLGEKCNIGLLLLLFVPVYLSAQVLYVAWTFRNVLYLFLFFLGYTVFSKEKAQLVCKKYTWYFLAVGLAAGIGQTKLYWEISYQEIVNHFLTMVYTWLMILGVIGLFMRYFDTANKVTSFLSQKSFGIYLFHYVPMVYIAYYLDTKCQLPASVNYLLTLLGGFVSALALTLMIEHVPVISRLFALKKGEKSPSHQETSGQMES